MAYEVKFAVPQRELGKSDVEFEVRQNGTMLGTLKISKGSLVWFPKGTGNGLRMPWEKFDRLMKDNATQIEKR